VLILPACCAARAWQVVLVTHQLQLLARPEVDLVALLHRRSLAALSSYRDLVTSDARDGSALLSHLQQQQQQQVREDISHSPAEKQASMAPTAVGAMDCVKPGTELEEVAKLEGDAESEGMGLAVTVRLVRSSLMQLQGRVIDAGIVERVCDMISGAAAEGADERKAEGIISRADFLLYLREFGTRWSLFLLLLVTVSSALLSVGANIYLSIWYVPPHLALHAFSFLRPWHIRALCRWAICCRTLPFMRGFESSVDMAHFLTAILTQPGRTAMRTVIPCQKTGLRRWCWQVKVWAMGRASGSTGRAM
jgi:hypothetical protein